MSLKIGFQKSNDIKFKNVPAAIKVAPATSFDKCSLSQMTSKTVVSPLLQFYKQLYKSNYPQNRLFRGILIYFHEIFTYSWNMDTTKLWWLKFCCLSLKKFSQKHNQVRTIFMVHTVGLWNANRCQVSFTICLFSREVNREKLDSQPHLIICNVGIEVLNRIVKVQTTECCKKSSSSLSKDLLWPPILFNFCE